MHKRKRIRKKKKKTENNALFHANVKDKDQKKYNNNN